MDIHEFTRKFELIFEDTEQRFVPSSSFKDSSEWNSLRALYLIAMIDSEFGVPFTTADLRSSNTIEDIFHIVQNKLG